MPRPALFAALLAVVLLAPACGDGGKPAAGGARPLTVGFSQIGAESAWRTANTQSIKDEAEKRGMKLVFADAQGKQENQIKALRNFVAQGVDVIAFSPVVETGFEPVLREIKAAGIPVVLTDRRVETTDPSLYATFIGADFVEEGRRAARWLVKATGGKANVVELQGTPGSAPALDRKKGFAEEIAAHPGVKIVFSQSGEFTRAKGKEVMEAFLKTADAAAATALFAHNDDMALGAIQALEEAGKKPGKEFMVVSIDAVRGAFDAMVAGTLNCTVECNPLIGPQVFDAVQKLAAKAAVEKRIATEAAVYEAADAAKILPTRKY
jgi:ABC-type sugar transport system substrate-binding protein